MDFPQDFALLVYPNSIDKLIEKKLEPHNQDHRPLNKNKSYNQDFEVTKKKYSRFYYLIP